MSTVALQVDYDFDELFLGIEVDHVLLPDGADPLPLESEHDLPVLKAQQQIRGPHHWIITQ